MSAHFIVLSPLFNLIPALPLHLFAFFFSFFPPFAGFILMKSTEHNHSGICRCNSYSTMIWMTISRRRKSADSSKNKYISKIQGQKLPHRPTPQSPLLHTLTINHLNWLKNKMFIALTFKREGAQDGLRNQSGNWSYDVSIFQLIKCLCRCLSERSDVPYTHTHTLLHPFCYIMTWATHHTNYRRKSIIRFYSTSLRNDLFMESLSDENYTPFQSPSLKGVLIVATQKETFFHLQTGAKMMFWNVWRHLRFLLDAINELNMESSRPIKCWYVNMWMQNEVDQYTIWQTIKRRFSAPMRII